jgi:hypothetical protein
MSITSALVVDLTDHLNNKYRLTGTADIEKDLLTYRLQSGSGTPLSLSNLGGLSALDLPVRPRRGWQDEAAKVVGGIHRCYTITRVW